MFFMTRKRFEDEVCKRVEDWQKRRMFERDLCEFSTRLYKLEERLDAMERKALATAKLKEVCESNV